MTEKELYHLLFQNAMTMTDKELYHLYRKPECPITLKEIAFIRSQILMPSMQEFGTAMANKGKKKKKR